RFVLRLSHVVARHIIVCAQHRDGCRIEILLADGFPLPHVPRYFGERAERRHAFLPRARLKAHGRNDRDRGENPEAPHHWGASSGRAPRPPIAFAHAAISAKATMNMTQPSSSCTKPSTAAVPYQYAAIDEAATRRPLTST